MLGGVVKCRYGVDVVLGPQGYTLPKPSPTPQHLMPAPCGPYPHPGQDGQCMGYWGPWVGDKARACLTFSPTHPHTLPTGLHTLAHNMAQLMLPLRGALMPAWAM